MAVILTIAAAVVETDGNLKLIYYKKKSSFYELFFYARNSFLLFEEGAKRRFNVYFFNGSQDVVHNTKSP